MKEIVTNLNLIFHKVYLTFYQYFSIEDDLSYHSAQSDVEAPKEKLESENPLIENEMSLKIGSNEEKYQSEPTGPKMKIDPEEPRTDKPEHRGRYQIYKGPKNAESYRRKNDYNQKGELEEFVNENPSKETEEIITRPIIHKHRKETVKYVKKESKKEFKNPAPEDEVASQSAPAEEPHEENENYQPRYREKRPYYENKWRNRGGYKRRGGYRQRRHWENNNRGYEEDQYHANYKNEENYDESWKKPEGWKDAESFYPKVKENQPEPIPIPETKVEEKSPVSSPSQSKKLNVEATPFIKPSDKHSPTSDKEKSLHLGAKEFKPKSKVVSAPPIHSMQNPAIPSQTFMSYGPGVFQNVVLMQPQMMMPYPPNYLIPQGFFLIL